VAERRADPETGVVWTLDVLMIEWDGAEVAHLVTREPSRHTTCPFAEWNTWDRVTNPDVARVHASTRKDGP
jgi:hypothetical protein